MAMVRAAVGMVAGAWLIVFGQPIAAAHLNASRINGRSYVSARDLARCYRAGNELVLRDHHRDITIEGVQHWLSFPVIASRGQLWVAQLDVLKTLDPVLRPGQFRKRNPVRLVVIDPGHGGADRGTRGRNGRSEKWLTLDLARRVARRLTDAGLSVELTRASDRTLELADRTDFAQRQQADLFVSIHFNSAIRSVNGVETYSLTPVGAASTAGGLEDGRAYTGNHQDEANLWLAHCVQQSLLRLTGAADRGVRRARFQVLRDAPCPAILVEAGFLSNAAEERKVLTAGYRDLLAKAIVEGILEYRKAGE